MSSVCQRPGLPPGDAPTPVEDDLWTTTGRSTGNLHTRNMPATTRLRPRLDGTRNGVQPTTPAAAQRLSSSRWRQPRLVVGLLLVAAAVVLGARVVAAVDDSVLVWRVESPARAGSSADGLEVRAVAVRFDDADTQAAYLSADQPLPTTGVVARPLAAGQLLTVADVQPADARSAAQLPLDVPSGSVPLDLAVGDRIDVWVVPGVPTANSAAVAASGQQVPAEAVRVLGGVRVAAVTAPGATVGDTRQLVVDVGSGEVEDLDAVIGQVATGSPVAVRVPAAKP